MLIPYRSTYDYFEGLNEPAEAELRRREEEVEREIERRLIETAERDSEEDKPDEPV